MNAKTHYNAGFAPLCRASSPHARLTDAAHMVTCSQCRQALESIRTEEVEYIDLSELEDGGVR